MTVVVTGGVVVGSPQRLASWLPVGVATARRAKAKKTKSIEMDVRDILS